MNLDPGVIPARRIVERLFHGMSGNLAVRLWDGAAINLGNPGETTPAATLVFGHAAPLRDLILHRAPFRLADEYVRGRVEVEGDIFAALALKPHLESLSLSLREKVQLLAAAVALPSDRAMPTEERSWKARLASWGSKAKNRRAIAFHYDVSNDFYRLWLDRQMIYSCAYFERPDRNSIRRNATSSTTSAASCGCNRVSACSTSGAAGAPWCVGPPRSTACAPMASP